MTTTLGVKGEVMVGHVKTVKMEPTLRQGSFYAFTAAAKTLAAAIEDHVGQQHDRPAAQRAKKRESPLWAALREVTDGACSNIHFTPNATDFQIIIAHAVTQGVVGATPLETQLARNGLVLLNTTPEKLLEEVTRRQQVYQLLGKTGFAELRATLQTPVITPWPAEASVPVHAELDVVPGAVESEVSVMLEVVGDVHEDEMEAPTPTHYGTPIRAAPVMRDVLRAEPKR